MWPGDAGHGRAVFWVMQCGCAAVVCNVQVYQEEEVGEDAPGAVEVEEHGGSMSCILGVSLWRKDGSKGIDGDSGSKLLLLLKIFW